MDNTLVEKWRQIEARLRERFGKRPNMEAVLFLIGIQELGQGSKKFTKEQKQDLMHIATCTLLAQSGYFICEGRDEDGWPHFRAVKPVPDMNLREQTALLKEHIIRYFESYGWDTTPPEPGPGH